MTTSGSLLPHRLHGLWASFSFFTHRTYSLTLELAVLSGLTYLSSLATLFDGVTFQVYLADSSPKPSGFGS